MSRSRRFPMWVITNQIDKFKAHRRVRKHVKQKLQTITNDPDGPDLLDIEADTRSLGCEEWGTKFGWNPAEILDGDEAEDRERASRK